LIYRPLAGGAQETPLFPFSPTFASRAKSLAAKGLRATETRRSAWALSDQAIVSAGNFLTTALMIGFMRRDEFARFGICFEVMCYLNSMQSSLVNYPLTVRGTTADDARLRKLASACLLFTLLLAPIAMLGMSIATDLLGRLQFAPWAIFAILAWQAQETTRRTLLCQFKYATALPGDTIAYFLQAVCMFVLAGRGELTLSTAFAAMGITSVLGCLLQCFQIGLAWVKVAELKTLAKDFWTFGRWSLCSNISTIFTDFSFNWLLAAHGGLDASAAFQVMGNLTKPCNTVMNAIPGVAMPAAARARKEGGFKAAMRPMLRYFGIGALVMSPYVLLLAISPQLIMKILYRHNAASYEPFAMVARVNILALILGYVANAMGTFLAALEETRYQFISSIVNTIAVFTIGLPLTFFGGLWGTILGCILCVWVRGICNLIFLYRVKNKSARVPSHIPVILPGPAAEADITTAEAIATTP
jgi:O-antigen/teichoic acid export membrane protein